MTRLTDRNTRRDRAGRRPGRSGPGGPSRGAIRLAEPALSPVPAAVPMVLTGGSGAGGRDALTGLLNRPGLMQALGRRAAEMKAVAGPPVLVLAELVQFGQVNRRFGHRTGDRVLRILARRLARGLGPGVIVARSSGATFAVICPRADAATRVAMRLHDLVRQPFPALGGLVVEPRIGRSAPGLRDPEAILSSAGHRGARC